MAKVKTFTIYFLKIFARIFNKFYVEFKIPTIYFEVEPNPPCLSPSAESLSTV